MLIAECPMSIIDWSVTVAVLHVCALCFAFLYKNCCRTAAQKNTNHAGEALKTTDLSNPPPSAYGQLLVITYGQLLVIGAPVTHKELQ